MLDRSPRRAGLDQALRLSSSRTCATRWTGRSTAIDFEDADASTTRRRNSASIPTSAAKIEEIKRLRPLSAGQPWGIFFVKFEPKRLPVVALRRILSRVVLKKRASANSAERAAWAGGGPAVHLQLRRGRRAADHLRPFLAGRAETDLPTLKVLGWDNLDTPLHLDHVADEL